MAVELGSLLRTTLLGLQTGMTLMLIASGLTLVFGLMDVANLAHGSFVMLGAYFALTIVSIGFGNFWLALLLVPIALGVIGASVERLTIKPLYGTNPLNPLLVTLGLAIIIEEGVSLIWSANPRNISAPAILQGTVDFGLFTYPLFQLFVLANSVVVVGFIWYGLTHSNFGIVMQASEHDPEMVQALGINVWKIYSMVFIAGAVLAGYAGVMLGTVQSMTPGMGLSIIIQAFAIIVIGGLGSFRGAVVGSLVIGLLTVFGTQYYPSVAELTVFVLMALVLLLKPNGLFGKTSA